MAVACATAACLGLAASPALATQMHVFSGSFGSAGSGAGQVSSPQGVAVNDATGDVYVADTGNARVDEFDSSGNFVRAWGWGVADGAASSETCTTTCQAGVPGSGVGQFVSPLFVAVDNSTGASTGDVYVGDTGDNLVTKFDSSGNVISSWGTGGQLSGPTGRLFGPLAGIAVDPSGNPWVYDTNTNGFEFDQSGALTQSWNAGLTTSQTGIGVDASDNLYAVCNEFTCNYPLELEILSSTGSDIGPLTSNQVKSVTGVAVDAANGQVYVDDAGTAILQYPTGCGIRCTPTATFGTGDLTSATGLAVDEASQTVYAADTGGIDAFPFVTLPDVVTGQATGAQRTSATLAGTVNANSTTLTDCHFDYVTDAAYNPSAANPYSAGGTAMCGSLPSGSTAVAVGATATGLTPDTLYHVRLQASNSGATGYGADQEFGTGPAVDGTSIGNVGQTSASVNAQINPDAAPTTYHVEYGTTAGAYTGQTGELQLGSGTSDTSAAAQLTGLQPGTTYHYRVVATNSADTTHGPDQTFATYQPPPTFAPCPNDALRYGYGANLPDCRAYEQVSPIDKRGANASGSLLEIGAAANGDAVTFAVAAGLPGIPGNTGGWNMYVGHRAGGGWSTENLLPAASAPWTAATGYGWSDDLTETFGSGAISGQGDAFVGDTATGSYRVIATDPSLTTNRPLLAGFSADDSKVVFEYPSAQLLPSAAGGRDNAYEYDLTSGTLSLVGMLPDQTTPAGGSFAGPYYWPSGHTTVGGAEAEMYTQGAVSSDGSRVFFTAGGTGQLYARVNPTQPPSTLQGAQCVSQRAQACTVRVSASQKTNGTGPEGADPNGPEPAAFMTATPDGSHVLLASSEELTNNATTGTADQGNDLYEYDVDTGALTDLAPDTTDPYGAGLQGVIGMSDDGSYVYFVASSVLAPGASPGSCCNAYVWHDGTISFIASLTAPDGIGTGESGDYTNWLAAPGDQQQLRSSRVTPDGRTLLFTSRNQLTDYDNHGFVEIYRYAASSGHPECVSCDPTGAAPVSPAALQPLKAGFAGAPIAPAVALTRNLSQRGERVFFDSADPLVSGATNGVENVYEWEADGAGSCQSDSQDGGCLYLISSGQSPDPSYFAGASASGSDVFLFTSQPLVGQDTDQLVDVYDAHVDGGLVAQNTAAPAEPCVGEACRPTPTSAPSAPVAATVTFAGPGDATSKSSQPPAGHVHVSAGAVAGSKMTVRVTVPAAGRVTANGADVTRRVWSLPRAGTYRLTLVLKPAVKRALKSKRRLRVSVVIGYTPVSYPGTSANVSMTVNATGRR